MDFNTDANVGVSFKSIWFVNTEQDVELGSALSSNFKNSIYEILSLKQLIQEFESSAMLPNILIIDRFRHDVDLNLPEHSKYVNLFSKIKVLLVTSETSDDIVSGWLSLGVYFYLRKPVEMPLLIQNISNIMQTAQNNPIKEFTLNNQRFFLDFGRLTIGNNDNQTAGLTKKEFMILNTLLEANGNWLSKDSILKMGWPDVRVGLKTIDVHILHLRRKVTPLNIKILNKRRLGYTVTLAAESTSD